MVPATAIGQAVGEDVNCSEIGLETIEIQESDQGIHMEIHRKFITN